MTVLAKSVSHMAARASRASSGAASPRSRSKILPWRTEATPSNPRLLSDPVMAWPCGSSTPVLRVTVTRAFIGSSLLYEAGAGRQRVVGFHKNAEPLRHFAIGIDEAAEVLAEAVLVHLVAGF